MHDVIASDQLQALRQLHPKERVILQQQLCRAQCLAGSSITTYNSIECKQTAVRVPLQAAFNLLVCSYALGDKKGMMAAFQKLLTAPALAGQRHEDDAPEADDESNPEGAADEVLLAGMSAGRGRWVGDGGEALDQLKQEQRQQQASSSR
jgi:hypothetical protein